DLRVNVDRTLANRIGATQRDVASDVLVSLSSSGQTAPNFWLNPETGVNYSILVQTPQYRIDSVEAFENTPIVPRTADAASEAPQLLRNVASVSRGASVTNATHYDITRTVDVLLGVQGADLKSVSDAVDDIVKKYEPELPRGSIVKLRGQVSR